MFDFICLWQLPLKCNQDNLSKWSTQFKKYCFTFCRQASLNRSVSVKILNYSFLFFFLFFYNKHRFSHKFSFYSSILILIFKYHWCIWRSFFNRRPEKCVFRHTNIHVDKASVSQQVPRSCALHSCDLMSMLTVLCTVLCICQESMHFYRAHVLNFCLYGD